MKRMILAGVSAIYLLTLLALFVNCRVGLNGQKAALDGDVNALRLNDGLIGGGGEVVAARLDDDEVQGREGTLQVFGGEQVRGDIVADGGVRAGPGLHGDDALRIEHSGRAQEPGILVGVDVIGDDADADLVGKNAADRRDE